MSANLCFIKFLLLSCLLFLSAECNTLKNFQSINDSRSENLGRGQGLISGGVKTERTETPWKIAIFQKKGSSTDYICGGSLLSRDLIVTAAHCLYQKSEEHEFPTDPTDPTSLKIILGAHGLDDFNEEGRKTAYVKEIIIHDSWDSTSGRFDHDIALIRLNEKVEFDQYIKPIRLMETTELKEFGKVVGWGAIDNKGNIADIAKIAKLKTIEILDCLKEYNYFAFFFWQESFCAQNEDQGVCKGDSGSGFYFEIDGEKYLKGIVSANRFGSICSKNEVALYTDITKYRDFIQEYFNYVKNVLKFGCFFDFEVQCYGKFDEFNFDLPATEIQLNHSGYSATEIERISFGNNIRKFPKFQKHLFKKSFPNSNKIVVNLKNDIGLAKQLPSFLKRVDWIREFEFYNLLIDEDSLKIFDEAKQMERLRLWDCKFPNDHLPARLFSKLTSLTYLEVIRSYDGMKGIKTLDENVFLSLTNLVQLILSNNRIKTLPVNLFQSLTKLEKLHLNGNEIEILPQNLFRNSQNLQRLEMTENKLKEIRVDFRTLPEIYYLSLFDNECIDEGFDGFDETSEIHEKAEYIMNKCKRT